MDLNKAVEYVAELRDETPETIRELVIAMGDSESDAVRRGIEDGKTPWPYPEDESPAGSVPWSVLVSDYKKAAITDFVRTPYGVVWLNSL